MSVVPWRGRYVRVEPFGVGICVTEKDSAENALEKGEYKFGGSATSSTLSVINTPKNTKSGNGPFVSHAQEDTILEIKLLNKKDTSFPCTTSSTRVVSTELAATPGFLAAGRSKRMTTKCYVPVRNLRERDSSKFPIGVCVFTDLYSFGAGVLVGWKSETDVHVMHFPGLLDSNCNFLIFMSRENLLAVAPGCVGLRCYNKASELRLTPTGGDLGSEFSPLKRTISETSDPGERSSPQKNDTLAANTAFGKITECSNLKIEKRTDSKTDDWKDATTTALVVSCTFKVLFEDTSVFYEYETHAISYNGRQKILTSTFKDLRFSADARYLPIVECAKERWRRRQQKTFAILDKLQVFAERAGLVPAHLIQEVKVASLKTALEIKTKTEHKLLNLDVGMINGVPISGLPISGTASSSSAADSAGMLADAPADAGSTPLPSDDCTPPAGTPASGNVVGFSSRAPVDRFVEHIEFQNLEDSMRSPGAVSLNDLPTEPSICLESIGSSDFEDCLSSDFEDDDRCQSSIASSNSFSPPRYTVQYPNVLRNERFTVQDERFREDGISPLEGLRRPAALSQICSLGLSFQDYDDHESFIEDQSAPPNDFRDLNSRSQSKEQAENIEDVESKERLRDQLRNLKTDLKEDIHSIGDTFKDEFGGIGEKVTNICSNLGKEIKEDKDVEEITQIAVRQGHKLKNAFENTVHIVEETEVGTRLKSGANKLVERLQDFGGDETKGMATDFGSKVVDEFDALGKGIVEREEIWKNKGMDILAGVQQRFLRRNPHWLEIARTQIINVIQGESVDLLGDQSISIDTIHEKTHDLKEELVDKLAHSKAFSVRLALASTCDKWVRNFTKREQSALECLEIWENKGQNLEYLENLDLPKILEKAGIQLPAGVSRLLGGSRSKFKRKRGEGKSGTRGDRSNKKSALRFESKTLQSLDISASDLTKNPLEALGKILANERVADKAERAMGSVDKILQKVNAASQSSSVQSLLSSAVSGIGTAGSSLDGQQNGTLALPSIDEHGNQIEGEGKATDHVSTKILSKLEEVDIGKCFDKAEETYDALMDQSRRQDLVNSLLDAAMDVVLGFLPNIKIDNLGGETDDWIYELENLDLAGFKLKKENVTLELNTKKGDPKLLDFKLWDMSCKIENLRFKYKQKHFPYMRGHGLAFAFVDKVSLHLSFSVKWENMSQPRSSSSSKQISQANSKEQAASNRSSPSKSQNQSTNVDGSCSPHGMLPGSSASSSAGSSGGPASAAARQMFKRNRSASAMSSQGSSSDSEFYEENSEFGEESGTTFDNSDDESNSTSKAPIWVPKLSMTHNEMRIPELKIHVEETRIAWVYNIVSRLFASLIQTILTQKIEEYVEKHVEDFSEVLSGILSHDLVRPIIDSLRPTNVDENGMAIPEGGVDAGADGAETNSKGNLSSGAASGIIATKTDIEVSSTQASTNGSSSLPDSSKFTPKKDQSKDKNNNKTLEKSIKEALFERPTAAMRVGASASNPTALEEVISDGGELGSEEKKPPGHDVITLHSKEPNDSNRMWSSEAWNTKDKEKKKKKKNRMVIGPAEVRTYSKENYADGTLQPSSSSTSANDGTTVQVRSSGTRKDDAREDGDSDGNLDASIGSSDCDYQKQFLPQNMKCSEAPERVLFLPSPGTTTSGGSSSSSSRPPDAAPIDLTTLLDFNEDYFAPSSAGSSGNGFVSNANASLLLNEGSPVTSKSMSGTSSNLQAQGAQPSSSSSTRRHSGDELLGTTPTNNATPSRGSSRYRTPEKSSSVSPSNARGPTTGSLSKRSVFSNFASLFIGDMNAKSKKPGVVNLDPLSSSSASDSKETVGLPMDSPPRSPGAPRSPAAQDGTGWSADHAGRSADNRTKEGGAQDKSITRKKKKRKKEERPEVGNNIIRYAGEDIVSYLPR